MVENNCIFFDSETWLWSRPPHSNPRFLEMMDAFRGDVDAETTSKLDPGKDITVTQNIVWSTQPSLASKIVGQECAIPFSLVLESRSVSREHGFCASRIVEAPSPAKMD